MVFSFDVESSFCWTEKPCERHVHSGEKISLMATHCEHISLYLFYALLLTINWTFAWAAMKYNSTAVWLSLLTHFEFLSTPLPSPLASVNHFLRRDVLQPLRQPSGCYFLRGTFRYDGRWDWVTGSEHVQSRRINGVTTPLLLPSDVPTDVVMYFEKRCTAIHRPRRFIWRIQK